MGSQVSEANSLTREPIAIVGSSCRFPGSSSPSRLWEFLLRPRDVVQEIPASRFSTKAFHHPDSQHHGSANVKHAYLLDEDPRAFDRDFFAINPKEAEAMDPQQRILLETVYEGVESAGYSIQQLRGSSTAVFVGCMSFDYQSIAIRGIDSMPQYHATGAAMSILANRISYFYDWKGPSVAIDTACSSSLVAMHQAVSALRNGDARMAVAAGSNLILGPEPFISESKLNMLSPNGHSCMWDAAADGYTRGEGFSVVLLKTLSQALADGDHIECIVRETGVNSDGKTPGITMPSSDAQAQLIRDTYARCGLDPTRESDRPQYFEAHGTGTPTGDPIEARAIQTVFFPDHTGRKDSQLIVGSIKTVIGHTEGAAGLAGVLKASLAVQHGQIPANLHFNKLNPKIRPFYSNLLVPTELMPWPAVPEGSQRRASVNSFGFGGTNAHAIIESWQGFCSQDRSRAPETHDAGPFVMSANSSQALAANAAALASYLQAHPDTHLGRLAYTMFRKTDFPFRAAFSATSAELLAEKLAASKQSLKSSPRIAATPQSLPPRFLGIFTGQGAQWATMGKELYVASDVFRSSMVEMQRSLDSLPETDRPSWSLIQQLCAPVESSRVGEASISQPLCTALQVAVVQVLRAAGIEFSAVVGHSSGEIGAAYAAGYLDAHDAIRIAYYRGVHCRLAQGPGGKRGKMMAVGLSFNEAIQFCTEFGTSLVVAASNSQTSCTLAGDFEAVEEAKSRLGENGIFARVLAVDTAYHSHHMNPCAIPYLDSMKQCGVQVQQGPKRCPWYSSVWGSNGRSRSFDMADGKLLGGQYWVDNLTHPVLFNQALARAVNEQHCFDFALEVGPHPALKGPSSETIKLLTGLSLPYSGVLKRGQSAVESFADALGLIWKSFPSPRPIVSFDRMRRAFSSRKQQKPAMLKGLPTYSWDHDSLLWKESRASRIFRSQSRPRHELLGHAVTYGEGNAREVHWKQIFRLNELPWLRGHRIQTEVMFPASGYVSMAYEAAMYLVDDHQSVRIVEMHDIDVMRVMCIEEDSSGLEVFFTVRITSQTDSCITADLACYSGAVDATQPLDTLQPELTAHFRGGLRLWLSQPDKHALPTWTTPLLPMETLDMEQVYSNLSDQGFQYSGSFRAKAMVRRLNHAVVTVSSPPEPPWIRACMHPAPVDTAIQGLLAGFSFPGDGRIGTTYLPTRIECVRVSTALSEPDGSVLKADSVVTSADATTIVGDVDLFDAADAHIKIQMRGVRMTAVDKREDRWLYAGKTWMRDAAYGLEPGQGVRLSGADRMLYEQLVRMAYFYLRQLSSKIRPPELMLMSKFRRHMMRWITEHLFPQIEADEHPDIRSAWKNDTPDMVQHWRSSQSSENNDLNLLHAMGQNLVGIVRGTVPPLKVLVQDGMLDRLYTEGLGFKDGNVDLGIMIKQLGHQHPRMRIVEVGAGTGGTTRTVLDALGNHYAAYTYTDISTGFFENARSVFSQHISRLTFKTLNIENDPAEQGFADGSFDMLIASNCLHATRSLQHTLRHCRRLLRPGGHLVLLEITHDFLPIQLIMATLPGWFLGMDEGRVWAPTVSLDRWDELLKTTGFSGVDVSSTPSYCSVIVSQAVDETVQLLRDPVSALPSQTLPPFGDFFIVGGTSSNLAFQAQAVLKAAVTTSVIMLPGLEGIQLPRGAAVLCLSDLDTPVFRDMNKTRFKGLQDVIKSAHVILWVTTGVNSGKDPVASLTVGMSSTLLGEQSDLRLQFLDVDDPASVDSTMLAKLLLRLALTDLTKREELLWTQEPELALRHGAIYIPRVLSLDTVNHRSAARHRRVTQVARLGSINAAVVLNDRKEGVELQLLPPGAAREDEIRLKVTATSLYTLSCDGYGKVYTCIGRDLTSNDKVLALSSARCSIVTVAEDRVLYRWHDDKAEVDDPAQLHLFMARALAEHLLRDVKGPAWIHGAPDDLYEAINIVARKQSKAVLQTTSNMARASEANFIHPYASERDVQRMHLRSLQRFVSLENSQNEALFALVRASLPSSAVVSMEVKELVGFGVSMLRTIAKQHFEELSHVPATSDQVLTIDKVLKETSKGLGPAAVVHWRALDIVTVAVRPLEHRGLFAADKTYLLFGMTGDLGISVCRWMVDHGARNVVLTSRSPSMPPGVLDFMSRKGATVRTMAVDITNRDSLGAAYADIKSSMPPIGGVMNAAMVLRDRLFHDMSWEDFATALAPKVQGTENLDELFGDEQSGMEFFICFSSATSTIGTAGQSAYAAANHFMAGLVKQRHRRGLPGSIVHIAVLKGLGYIFRRSAEYAAVIDRTLLPRLARQAETDLHEILAEAILCGRPGSDQPADLITGIRRIFQGSWPNDPRLSCYLGQQLLQNESAQGQATWTVSVESQLSMAGEPAECLAVLEKCFAQALGNMLEIDPEQVDRNMPVARLGIDSLVAIRIREWFLKEVGIEVPVLKVMSVSHSLTRMCDDVLVGWRRLKKEAMAPETKKATPTAGQESL
ncbi:Polyketide synthase 19 [Conoideocrella luteorostrata]|uniref:Polyketide synthase 19 n=1 Tax=Conoideocrella luteorostrata TaxID=1105319 RepID=A0AAJ0FUJ2_9HYPO|nr:Polyketide synthase 19 [Conoideocrella luteorostrata]